MGNVTKYWVCGIIWLLCLGLFASHAETFKVGLHLPDRRPFFWVDEEKKDKGIYVDLLKAIGQKIGVEMKFLYMSQAELIGSFNRGVLDIEPGISPRWRPSEKEKQISIYSETFLTLDDVLIYPMGRSILPISKVAELSLLKGYTVGQVRGFYVPGELELVWVKDELTIALMVDRKRLDVGFQNALVAAYYRDLRNLEYQISKPYSASIVSMRLFHKRQPWLKAINEAIHQFKADGTLPSILKRYGL